MDLQPNAKNDPINFKLKKFKKSYAFLMLMFIALCQQVVSKILHVTMKYINLLFFISVELFQIKFWAAIVIQMPLKLKLKKSAAS